MSRVDGPSPDDVQGGVPLEALEATAPFLFPHLMSRVVIFVVLNGKPFCEIPQ